MYSLDIFMKYFLKENKLSDLMHNIFLYIYKINSYRKILWFHLKFSFIKTIFLLNSFNICCYMKPNMINILIISGITGMSL